MPKTHNFFLIGLFWLLALTAGAETQSRLTFYHADLNGTVLATTDEAGNLKWRRSHAPYGEPLTQDTHPETVAYTGHVQDKSTGLVYMQARYYDPRTGRFLSQDPVGFVDTNPMSFNRYVYANNNPYRYRDPDGLWAVSIEGYVGYGGGISFGQNPGTEEFFIGIKAGFGVGGGFEYSPMASSPQEKNYFGLYANGGVSLGNGDFSMEFNEGVVSGNGTGSTDRHSGREPNFSVSEDNPIKAKASASFGISAIKTFEFIDDE